MAVILPSTRAPVRNNRSGVHTLEMTDTDPLFSMRQDLEDAIRLGKLQVPPLSGTANELNTLAANPNATLDNAMNIIQREPNLAARVMRMANSAMMRAVNPVTDLKRAVMRVGIVGVRDMALALAMGQLCRTQTFKNQFAQAYKNSYTVACASQWSCQTLGLDRGVGFLCGLLHDLGVIALLTTLGATRNAAIAAHEPAHLQLILDDLHPQAGESIVTQWKLPPSVAEVARWHHNPERCMSSPMVMLVAALTRAATVEGNARARADAFADMPPLFQAGLGRHHLLDLATVMEQAAEDELVKMLSG